MFSGNYELVIPTPAREYVDTRKPIWRGVAKGNDLLIAAHNPYAKDENEVVTVEVAHKNYRQNVTLKGYEVFLCKFDMTLLSTENSGISTFEVSPNPANEQIFIHINSLKEQIVPIEVFDISGKKIFEEKHDFVVGKNHKTLNISHLATGLYFIRVLGLSKKIVVDF